MSRQSFGRHGFATRFGLHSEDDTARIGELLQLVQANDVESVRLSFVDQHGLLRGKTVLAKDLGDAFANGVSMTSTLLLKDTSHRTVFPVWGEQAVLGFESLRGAADFLMLPDPATFRLLPWLKRTAWLLCDIYFTDGRPVPFSSRAICADALARLNQAGFGYRSGLEVELHVFRLLDQNLGFSDSTHPATPPSLELPAHGFQYLTESRGDELEPITSLIQQIALQLNLPLRSVETEFGPGQIEFTFHPTDGLSTADNMVLFRSAVKQVCRRNGYHATFMCRPGMPNLFSSGWHIHQSLYAMDSGENVFMPESPEKPLSATGLGFVAGLLEHAAAACVFTTPTINGYKRYQPHALAPDRISWGLDNKAAMLRVLGGPGDSGSRVENRVPEPAANPYLVFASQILAGLDGIQRSLEPPPVSTAPYQAGDDKLPTSLFEAVHALKDNEIFCGLIGQAFVDYIVAIKQAELARFMSEVTDWEQREYLELF